jgi:hypothetical protein
MTVKLTELFLPCRSFPATGADHYKWSENPPLIRFMDRNGVMSLLQNKALKFSAVSKFRSDDPSEGLGGLPLRPHIPGYGNLIYGPSGASFTKKAVPSEHFPAKFWETISKSDYGFGHTDLKEKLSWAKEASAQFLSCCFHVYHEEPYAMWKLYGHDEKGLALVTSKDAVLKSLPPELQEKSLIGHGEVFYANNLAEAAELWRTEDLPEALIRIKSSRYKVEEEFRFFLRSKQSRLEYFSPFDPNGIDCIIIGPGRSLAERKSIRTELEHIMSSSGLKIRLVDSEQTLIRKLLE